MGFEVKSISRMHKKINAIRTKLPLLLLQLPNYEKGKKIYNVQKICHIEMKMKLLKHRISVNQCHRCQEFRHNQIIVLKFPGVSNVLKIIFPVPAGNQGDVGQLRGTVFLEL